MSEYTWLHSVSELTKTLVLHLDDEGVSPTLHPLPDGTSWLLSASRSSWSKRWQRGSWATWESWNNWVSGHTWTSRHARWVTLISSSFHQYSWILTCLPLFFVWILAPPFSLYPVCFYVRSALCLQAAVGTHCFNWFHFLHQIELNKLHTVRKHV